MNSLKETGADIGNSLATVLAPVLKDISGALKAFSEIWNNIPEPVQNTIIKIALLAATIGPLLVAGGKVISAIGTITSAIGSLTTFLGIGTAATTAAGTAATATGAAVGAASIPLLPIIGIIAAIIAAVVAIIAIVKNWGAITDWFKGVWSGFCDGIQTAWTAVGNFFTQTLPNFFSDVGQKWSDGWNTMKTNAGNIWDSIKSGVGTSIDNIKTNVGNGLDNVKQSFSDKLSAAHEIEEFHPTETWHSGMHILNLFYPLLDMQEKTLHTFEVWISIAPGAATIAAQCIIASITGQGLGAQDRWDGRITVKDELSPILINVMVLTVTGMVSVEKITRSIPAPQMESITTITPLMSGSWIRSVLAKERLKRSFFLLILRT